MPTGQPEGHEASPPKLPPAFAKARRTAAAVIVAIALLAGCVTALRSARADRTTLAAVGAGPRTNGRLALFHDSGDQFVDFVLNLVPEGTPVRILQPETKPAPGAHPNLGPAGRCGNQVNTPRYWLLVYRLVPRPSVCDDAHAWTIYFGVPVPSGPNVHKFSATLGARSP